MTRIVHIVTIALIASSAAFAQTSPTLMIRPWAQLTNANPAVEAWQDVLVMPGAEGDRGYDASISIYETAARWRLDPAAEHSVTLGFQQTIIDGGSNAVIDLRNRVSQSLAIGIPLGQTDDDWKFAATAGFGYAGNNAYADSSAWYGLGSFIASKKLDESSSLQLLLVYDGNRSLWPDLPLPAVSYNHKVSDELAYSLGLPYSSVVWRPIDKLTINASYVIPSSARVSATYELLDVLDVFASYDRALYVFHDNSLRGTERVFFSHQRIEGGLRWLPCEYIEGVVAGGLAFDQRFERGYDVRDLHNTADLDSSPYIRFAVDIRF